MTMYEDKHFYFEPNYDFKAMAKNGDYFGLLKAAENVTLELDESRNEQITATNHIQYLFNILRAQNATSTIKSVALIFMQLFTKFEDYNSLVVLRDENTYGIFSAEAKAVIEKIESYRQQARDMFEITMNKKEFKVEEPFEMKFEDGKLTFKAPNGIEYRVYRTDHSDFGKLRI